MILNLKSRPDLRRLTGSKTATTTQIIVANKKGFPNFVNSIFANGECPVGESLIVKIRESRFWMPRKKLELSHRTTFLFISYTVAAAGN